jgi:integrase
MLKAEKRHRRRCRYQEYDRQHAKCTCPYQATGTLNGVFIRKSLKTSSYERAIAVICEWETSGSTRDEKPITIEEAVAAFMRDIGVRNWQEPTKRKFHTLLEDRLLGFAKKQGYLLLKDLNLHAVTEFRGTWCDSPLTAQKNIERLRAFFRFAMDREWCSSNPASKLKVRVRVEEKDPFTAEESARILEATHLYGDGHGRTDQLNAEEVRVMVLVLRFSGLRISDAVKLTKTQLVPSADGDGFGLLVEQQKVRRAAYIPLPDGRDGLPDVVGALRGLPPKGEKYFFWTGNGGLDTAVNNWRARLDALFKLAESQTGGWKPFTNKPHPHRFRHTFAAEYLNAGVPIETVSLLLGHASVRVTEKHYAKFNRARQVRIDDAVRAAWKSRRRDLQIVRGGSKSAA